MAEDSGWNCQVLERNDSAIVYERVLGMFSTAKPKSLQILHLDSSMEVCSDTPLARSPHSKLLQVTSVVRRAGWNLGRISAQVRCASILLVNNKHSRASDLWLGCVCHSLSNTPQTTSHAQVISQFQNQTPQTRKQSQGLTSTKAQINLEG